MHDLLTIKGDTSPPVMASAFHANDGKHLGVQTSLFHMENTQSDCKVLRDSAVRGVRLVTSITDTGLYRSLGRESLSLPEAFWPTDSNLEDMPFRLTTGSHKALGREKPSGLPLGREQKATPTT